LPAALGAAGRPPDRAVLTDQRSCSGVFHTQLLRNQEFPMVKGRTRKRQHGHPSHRQVTAIAGQVTRIDKSVKLKIGAVHADDVQLEIDVPAGADCRVHRSLGSKVHCRFLWSQTSWHAGRHGEGVKALSRKVLGSSMTFIELGLVPLITRP
jgi:hypothetical protein